MQHPAWRRDIVVGLMSIVAMGCGVHRVAPLSLVGSSTLVPTVEDPDAGRVGIAPTVRLSDCPVFLVDAFPVKASEVKDEEDRWLAETMPCAEAAPPA